MKVGTAGLILQYLEVEGAGYIINVSGTILIPFITTNSVEQPETSIY